MLKLLYTLLNVSALRRIDFSIGYHGELTSWRYEVQASAEANLFRDKNNLLHQYPEKIAVRQGIRIVTGYPLDTILDIKGYHQYVQWISRG